MATPPPSNFAALLRRSKFASYDPSISQVYTTYGGDAHRGNFGLKRPLPLRRRNAHVVVGSVDSKEQQTEWRSAEPQNRWIRMWNEVGGTPRIQPRGSWSEKLGHHGDIDWKVDSEFSKGTSASLPYDAEVRGAVEGISTAVPNIHAMSDKEFGRYLEKLRKMRPVFREFMEKQCNDKPALGEPNLWEQSNSPGDRFKTFLSTQAYTDYNAPGARQIEQQPHRYAGLTYSKTPRLQTYFTTKSQQGRVLEELDMRGRKDYIVGFAGMTPVLSNGAKGSIDPANLTSALAGWSADQEIPRFRFMHAVLNVAPTTVGSKPGGLEGVELRTFVCADDVEDVKRANPHTPGSREYVGHIHEKPIHRSMTRPAEQKPTTTQETWDQHADLLSTLASVVTQAATDAGKK
ncbi:hypothetical protein A0H81_14287 [Grifola frondosa]|uniref:Uncharacterized protein n=1 Tax=Grifola frondosa TaxID=5627 RepID=A0A1C7LSA8_GRIFR|nr:hypothetical protein A0H81_14287 [Grifola frondosa]